MENIEHIPRIGKWSDSTEKIDDNFRTFESELISIEDDDQKCKGLFPSLQSLNTKFPNPTDGSWAYIGTKLPAPIYVFKSPGGWTNTGKVGGKSLDPEKIYLNSSPVNGNLGGLRLMRSVMPLEGGAESLFATSTQWIVSSDEGKSWEFVVDNLIKIPTDRIATSYILRLSSLSFGEDGELLTASILEPDIYVFHKGELISMTISSGSGITEEYTNNKLSWKIGDMFFKGGIGNNRMPIVGDTIRTMLSFNSPSSDNRISVTIFKFSV